MRHKRRKESMRWKGTGAGRCRMSERKGEKMNIPCVGMLQGILMLYADLKTSLNWQETHPD